VSDHRSLFFPGERWRNRFGPQSQSLDSESAQANRASRGSNRSWKPDRCRTATLSFSSRKIPPSKPKGMEASRVAASGNSPGRQVKSRGRRSSGWRIRRAARCPEQGIASGGHINGPHCGAPPQIERRGERTPRWLSGRADPVRCRSESVAAGRHTRWPTEWGGFPIACGERGHPPSARSSWRVSSRPSASSSI
jgi:hypothetical protein